MHIVYGYAKEFSATFYDWRQSACEIAGVLKEGWTVRYVPQSLESATDQKARRVAQRPMAASQVALYGALFLGMSGAQAAPNASVVRVAFIDGFFLPHHFWLASHWYLQQPSETALCANDLSGCRFHKPLREKGRIRYEGFRPDGPLNMSLFSSNPIENPRMWHGTMMMAIATSGKPVPQQRNIAIEIGSSMDEWGMPTSRPLIENALRYAREVGADLLFYPFSTLPLPDQKSYNSLSIDYYGYAFADFQSKYKKLNVTESDFKLLIEHEPLSFFVTAFESYRGLAIVPTCATHLSEGFSAVDLDERPDFPVSFRVLQNLLVVAEATQDGKLAPGSCWGSRIDIATTVPEWPPLYATDAPKTSWARDSRETSSNCGAAAKVLHTAIRLKAEYPHLSPAEIKELLLSSGRPIREEAKGKSHIRLLDERAALRAARKRMRQPSAGPVERRQDEL